MVHFICPYCSNGMDGTPDCDDIAQWYAQHYPHLPVDSPVPGVCSDCARRYAPGDQVVLRSRPDVVFTVVGVIASPSHPELVTVRHPDGHQVTYAKSQIRLPSDSEASAPRLPKEEGYF
ncbi:hypothetical protein [Bremerella sp.]|uniref:hypothetical protein n=1 Tax=Bremerella sp. TaxID=2795602 RepID=UPI003918D54C